MDRGLRKRLVPWRAAVAALTGVAMLGAGVGGAGAITLATTDLVAVSQPTVGLGQTSALAGNWTLTPTPLTATWAAGEVVTIAVDDSGVPPNCTGGTPAANFVAFNAAPTVTVAGTATVTVTTTSSSVACGALTTPRRDQVVITFVTGGTGTLTISNVRYDIGTAVLTGPVAVTAIDSAAPSPVVALASNAFLTGALLTANTPAVGLRTGSGIQPISNVVVTEQVLDAAGGLLCVRTDSGLGDAFDATAPAPTVVVSGGTGDTATVALATALPGGANSGLQLTITDSLTDTAASTFTIGGLRLDAPTTAVKGAVSAVLTSGLCSAAVVPANTLSASTVIAGVVTTNRFGGADRFTTAQILFEDAFPCTPLGNGLANAIVARSDDFPDALAASYLAGKLAGNPLTGTGILLVDKDSTTLPPATINALRNRGVDKVTIVGGTTAVPAALATALAALPNVKCDGTTVEASPNATIAVDRVFGTDRYETARNIAERPGLGAAGTADYDGTAADPDGATCAARKTAILATGDNFPDALVAGPVAFNGHNVIGTGPGPVFGCGDGQGFPVILTNGTSLNAQAAAALTNLGIQQVLVMGGNAAIDPAVVTAVQGINSITTKRFAGGTRLDTAKQFAEFAIGFLGYDRNLVSVARGDNFPDALAGGPHAGTPNLLPFPTTAATIILTDSPTSVGTETTAFFKGRQGTVGVYGATAPLSPITDIDVYGQTGALADSTVASILAAISQA